MVFLSKQIDKKKHNKMLDLSADAIMDQPVTPFEMVNKYGTYEIQPTADTENSFPHIAQGLPPADKRKEAEE